jgi:hypothetical protein
LITLSAFGCPQLESGSLIEAVWSLDRSIDGSTILKFVVPPEKGRVS